MRLEWLEIPISTGADKHNHNQKETDRDRDETRRQRKRKLADVVWCLPIHRSCQEAASTAACSWGHIRVKDITVELLNSVGHRDGGELTLPTKVCNIMRALTKHSMGFPRRGKSNGSMSEPSQAWRCNASEMAEKLRILPYAATQRAACADRRNEKTASKRKSPW